MIRQRKGTVLRSESTGNINEPVYDSVRRSKWHCCLQKVTHILSKLNGGLRSIKGWGLDQNQKKILG